MREITLNRLQHFNSCTRGVIVIGDDVFYTLELPDRDNASNISRIPEGDYTCVIRKSRKYGTTYHVTNVIGRSYILVHSGNIARHTKGCILIGSRFGSLYGHRAVLSSKPALRKFNTILDNKPFLLKVRSI